MTPPDSPSPPGLPPALARDLRRRLGDGAVVTDPDRLLVYESDGLPHYRSTPAAVVLPQDTEEAAWTVGRLHEAGIPVVPRGAGTGLSGGAVGNPGSVLVGTARMRRILALEPENGRARVQAGVLNAELSLRAAPHGLHYAPDPSSQSACTLGGNVAENSGGPHCLKYGVTSRYVTGLTVVAAGGQVVELGGMGTPGRPDLVGLFVGSEGCFGLATEIEVRLVPRAPAARTLLAVFGRLEEAGGAVSAIIAGGLLPAALEILDRATIAAVEDSIFAAGYPRGAGAVLVVEFDGLEGELDADADRAQAICVAHGATEVRRAREEADRARLWKGRKKAFGAMGRLAPDMVVQDATVPRSRLPDVLARISAVADRHRLHIANVFHAGDGNLHPNILFDRRDPDQVDRVERASKEIMALCVEAGGTITGEHGVGLDKRRYMHLVHGPEELAAMAAVRRVFDPRGLWNPGKVLPDGVEAAGPYGTARTGASQPGAARVPAPSEIAAVEGVEFTSPGGRLVARPRDEAALARLVARAGQGGWRLLPPRTPGGDAVVVDTGGLAGVQEYEPADLTLTVGAGTTLNELTARTAVAGQWWPVDAPGLEEATVGEVVLQGVRGALAAAHGGVRDWVLGLTLVAGNGRTLRLGGRVVKNVAGFDLVRLVVGSGGALGLPTAVTLRLQPLPAVDRSWFVRADRPEELAGAARRLVAAPVRPVALELGWGPVGAVLAVRAAGSEVAVDTVGRAVREAFPEATRTAGAEAEEARLSMRSGLTGCAESLEIPGLPGRLTEGLARARRIADEAGASFRGWAAADLGAIRIGLPEGCVGRSRGASGVAGTEGWLLGLKRAFDPHGVFPSGPFAVPPHRGRP